MLLCSKYQQGEKITVDGVPNVKEKVLPLYRVQGFHHWKSFLGVPADILARYVTPPSEPHLLPSEDRITKSGEERIVKNTKDPTEQALAKTKVARTRRDLNSGRATQGPRAGVRSVTTGRCGRDNKQRGLQDFLTARITVGSGGVSNVAYAGIDSSPRPRPVEEVELSKASKTTSTS